MSSYKKLGFGLSGGNPIVLDIGEKFTKVGIAGEPEPRAIIPTAIQQIGGPVTYILKSDRNVITHHHEDGELKKSITKFLEKVFFKTLQINPKHQKILLCESLLNPTKIREEIAQVLFHHFEVASLVFAPHHLLSCFTIASGTALVVDCSYNETLVLPVIEGTPILWAWQAAPLGGAVINDQIMKEISENGRVEVGDGQPSHVTSRLSDRILEDIKVKACFVADNERAKSIQAGKMQEIQELDDVVSMDVESLKRNLIPEMIYPLDGITRLIIPGSVREEAAEVLFEQDNDNTSIPTLILDSLLHCPIVSRKQLASNILITGGTSMLPGYRHRLFYELKKISKNIKPYKMKLAQCEFRLHNPLVPANLVSWLGASIFASLETFQRRSLTREFYDQHNGKVPDWCGLPLPDKMPEPSPPHMTSPFIKGSIQLSSKKK